MDADEQAVVSEALQRDGMDGARLVARLEDSSEKRALARFVADGDVRDGVVDRRAVDLLAQVDDDAAAAMFKVDVDDINPRELRESILTLHKEKPDQLDEIETFTQNAHELSDVEGTNEVIKPIINNPSNYGNFKGSAYELEVGMHLRRERVRIVQFERQVKTAGGSTDIDIVTAQGRMIEVKAQDYTSTTKTSDKYQNLIEKMTKYKKYRDDIEDIDGPIEVYFDREPHPDIINKLREKGIGCKIYSDGRTPTCSI